MRWKRAIQQRIETALMAALAAQVANAQAQRARRHGTPRRCGGW
jgi:hypothetical protein